MRLGLPQKGRTSDPDLGPLVTMLSRALKPLGTMRVRLCCSWWRVSRAFVGHFRTADPVSTI